MATALLKKKANIPPLQLYIEATAMQRMQNECNSNVIKYIKTCLNKLWRDLRVPHKRKNQQPQSREDILAKQVEKAEEKWHQAKAQAYIKEKKKKCANTQQSQQQKREQSQNKTQKSIGEPFTAT